MSAVDLIDVIQLQKDPEDYLMDMPQALDVIDTHKEIGISARLATHNGKILVYAIDATQSSTFQDSANGKRYENFKLLK